MFPFLFSDAFIHEAEEQSTFGTRRLPSSRKRQTNENLVDTLAKIAENGDVTGTMLLDRSSIESINNEMVVKMFL